jgi:16S rRNA processing protein RimM
VHGGVRVEVLTDRPEERFTPGTVLRREGGADPLTIVEARPATPGWVLRFRELPTRDAVEALRGVYLEADAPAASLPRGTYYWHELVGVPVTDLDGGPLGTVRDVYRSGGAEVLVVGGGPRGDFDLPIARPFVRVLAPRRGEIAVDAAALDLPEAGDIRPPRPPRPPRPVRRSRPRGGPRAPAPAAPSPVARAAGRPPADPASGPAARGSLGPNARGATPPDQGG